MLRIFGLILAVYLVGLTVVDTVAFGGRYRAIVWQEANYRAYRVSVEVRYLLDKASNWAHATNFAVPSHADDGR
jgi:hypothetical protein